MQKKCSVCGIDIGLNSKSMLCKEHRKKACKKKYYEDNYKAKNPYAFRVAHVKGKAETRIKGESKRNDRDRKKKS